MDKVFETRLIECLSALEENEPIEQILARYPEDAQRLRPILQIASELPGLAMEPSLKAQEDSRQRLLTTAQMLASPKHGGTHRPGWRPPILETLGVVIMVFGVSAMLFAISGSALPDTPLYGLKLAVEEARLVFAAGEDSHDTLKQQFNQERINEIETLLTRDGQSEVAFEGTIESIQTESWQISGLAVIISSSTQITGDPQAGLTAQVQGQVISGRLLADEIIIEPVDEPAEEPAPEPTDTYEPESTPISRPTQELFPTVTPSVTLTPLSTPTPARPAEEDHTDDDVGEEEGDD